MPFLCASAARGPLRAGRTKTSCITPDTPRHTPTAFLTTPARKTSLEPQRRRAKPRREKHKRVLLPKAVQPQHGGSNQKAHLSHTRRYASRIASIFLLDTPAALFTATHFLRKRDTISSIILAPVSFFSPKASHCDKAFSILARRPCAPTTRVKRSCPFSFSLGCGTTSYAGDKRHPPSRPL